MSSNYSLATKRKAKRLYVDKEMPIEQITKEPGMPSARTLRKWLLADGVKLRPRYQRRYPRKKILAMLNAEVPRSKIRAKYGCSEKFLSDLANGKIAA